MRLPPIDYAALGRPAGPAGRPAVRRLLSRYGLPSVICLVAVALLWIVGAPKAALVGIAVTVLVLAGSIVAAVVAALADRRTRSALGRVAAFAEANGLAFDAVARRVAWTTRGVLCAVTLRGRVRLIAGPLGASPASFDPPRGPYPATSSVVGELVAVAIEKAPITDPALWGQLFATADSVAELSVSERES